VGRACYLPCPKVPLADDAPALAKALERACPSALRARGRTLAGEGRARFVRRDDDAYEYAVADGSGRIHDVVLFPADAEWSCDCDGRFDACEHVAAALFTPLARGPDEGPVGPVALRYELRRVDGGLSLRRYVELSDGTRRVASRADLAALPGRTAADERIERLLAEAAPGRLRAPLLGRVVTALAGVEGLLLDGRPVQVGRATPGARVVVRDEGRGVVVRLVRDGAIDERFDGGVVRIGDTLHPLRPVPLPSHRRRALAEGIYVPPEDFARLAGEVLPELRRSLPVKVRTRRLPSSATARPVLDAVIERGPDALRVRVRVVYGRPPIAAVTEDGGFEILDPSRPVPIRRPEEEAALLRRARAALDLPPGDVLSVEGDDVPRLAQGLHDDLAALGIDPDPALETCVSTGTLAPAIADGTFSFQAGSKRADPRAVLAAHAEGRTFVRLEGGEYAEIPAAFLDAHGDLVEAFLEARAQGAPAAVTRWAAAALSTACDPAADPERPAGLVELAAGADGPTPAGPHPALRADLRPYQREGVRFLSQRKALGLGALLADDMGLGKTVQTLAVLDGRTLVVAPTSVLGSWQAQAERFRPDLRVARYHGAGRRLDPEADLVITSYGVLRRDVDALARVDWDTVVLDESHTIKNPNSQVARAALALPARFHLALSGTPVENRLEDLWPQLSFMVPGLFGSLASFRRRYAARGAAGRARLERRVRPFVLRRTKSEVARDLPPRTDLVHEVELSSEERAFYAAVAAAARTDVARLGPNVAPMRILEALLRVRQAACDAAIVPGAPPALCAGPSAKLARLAALLEELLAEGHKVLVFSQWTKLLDRVEAVVAQAGAAFARLDGATADRDGVVARFQDPSGPPVMLVSLRAGGVGLTLTAADHVVLLDPWWNPAVEEQAAGRAHRIGQTRPVIVHRILAAGTIEAAIENLKAEKRALSAEMIRGDGAALDRATALALLDSA